ncbi:MAG: 6-phosphogluconolactonase [Phycisphaerae bacterium]|nr:6-phosphogluconolactonase [Phycisphaerae bacterium]
MGISADYRPKREVVSDTAFADRCVEIFVSEAKKAIGQKGFFFVAISGGHTPAVFFERLGQSQTAIELPWKKVHLFWVDERYVPPDSKNSNYKLAADTFLGKVSIPKENVHRIPTEYDDIKEAADVYERTLREVFVLKEGQLPQFDLIVLGMGADGHTGSLFQSSYASLDTSDLACVVYVMNHVLHEKLNRITITYPVMRAAKHLLVLVSGEEKAEILKEIMTSEPDEIKYPIHLLWPVLFKVTWLIDEQAARLLK